MIKVVKVAILGATGYVGMELVKILNNHPHIEINFLGSESKNNLNPFNSNKDKNYSNLPQLSFNKEFDPKNSEAVFLALPHGVTQSYVKEYFNKINIFDLSADFRLDSLDVYEKNYGLHCSSELLDDFVYGLSEVNSEKIKKYKNVAIPGCYPTSILLPLIPLIENNLIETSNIIIDSKSGYSGAGKKFDMNNIKNSEDQNFYNYNTNNHRHICEIQQELNKYSISEVNFSFNPHILPCFRGMMSTIYCDLKKNIKYEDIYNQLIDYYKDSTFVNIVNHKNILDFFSVQNTNNCLIKTFKNNSNNNIILVSLIDNLLKGAAGQAVQCFNKIYDFKESLSLEKFR